jgi:hypothetical protein
MKVYSSFTDAQSSISSENDIMSTSWATSYAESSISMTTNIMSTSLQSIQTISNNGTSTWSEMTSAEIPSYSITPLEIFIYIFMAIIALVLSVLMALILLILFKLKKLGIMWGVRSPIYTGSFSLDSEVTNV